MSDAGRELSRARRADEELLTDRTTIRLSDERNRLLDRASAIVASGPGDDPPRSDVVDAALTHLIQSKENIEDARGEIDPQTVQRLADTDVIALHYRPSVDSR